MYISSFLLRCIGNDARYWIAIYGGSEVNDLMIVRIVHKNYFVQFLNYN